MCYISNTDLIHIRASSAQVVYGQSLLLQFPLDVDASYHAAGLEKGEDLFNKEDLSQFQASGESHNISQHIATYPYGP